MKIKPPSPMQAFDRVRETEVWKSILAARYIASTGCDSMKP